MRHGHSSIPTTYNWFVIFLWLILTKRSMKNRQGVSLSWWHGKFSVFLFGKVHISISCVETSYRIGHCIMGTNLYFKPLAYGKVLSLRKHLRFAHNFKIFYFLFFQFSSSIQCWRNLGKWLANENWENKKVLNYGQYFLKDNISPHMQVFCNEDLMS